MTAMEARRLYVNKKQTSWCSHLRLDLPFVLQCMCNDVRVQYRHCMSLVAVSCSGGAQHLHRLTSIEHGADNVPLIKYTCVHSQVDRTPNEGGRNAKAADPVNHTLQVLHWALASDNSLDEESKHGKHGQPPVLDFLHLHSRNHSLRTNHMQRPQSLWGTCTCCPCC